MKVSPAKLNWSLLVGFLVALLSIFSIQAQAQSTQTVRGRILDDVSKTPLIGVNIRVVSITESVVGAATDVDGYFRIDHVPLGRHSFHISYIGYEEQTVPDVIVTAAKEVILNINLIESVNQLNEVVVTANTREDKTATNNELAVVSARSFNVDDTKRYAGALGDPSRMAANFAGVVGGNDSRNDIVVRGNSPTGMLWQLEGLNIPNPNHFGALMSTGGPVSMLNNNNLDKSDFMTSAFPAQYGNATAGVFDIRLREGNNQKREWLGQVGFNGFEVGGEGPFKQGGRGSYLVNYRYSTLGIFKAMGIDFGAGSAVPLYQDINFKIALPAGKQSKWTLFGLGGKSAIDLLGSEADLSKDNNLYGGENEDSYPRYATGIAGVSYETKLSASTFFKVTGGVSATHEKYSADSLVRDSDNKVTARYRQGLSDMKTQKYALVLFSRTKFNARNSLTSGATIDATDFTLLNQSFYANVNRDTTHIDVTDQVVLYQAYSTWRHRFSERFSLNAGIHAQYYSRSDDFVAEPRVSLQYVMDGNRSLSVGYGVHHQTQSIYTSYVQTKTNDGTPALTNKNLGFTRSEHYVLTYDWNLSEHLRLKAETYYQQLTNVPVERTPSSYSVLNTGASFAPNNQDSLVNAGKGHNYGVELTLERFFHRGYYFLITTSLFDSRYQGSDGVERNTAFNTQYVANALLGKEWRVGRNRNYLTINLKATTIGGRYLTPINFALSQQQGRTVYEESRAFSEKQTPYFRTDIKISYRKEYKRSTLEMTLDLQNITNNQNIFVQSYNPRTNSIGTQYQQGFFPVPFVRYTF